MTNSQLHVKQTCLPCIISNVTNNKNEMSSQKVVKNYNCNPFYLLQVRLTVPSFVFTASIKRCFNVLSGYFRLFWLNLMAVSTVWVLINFVTQLLGLFTDRNDTFSYPFIYSRWNTSTFSYTSSLKKVLFSDGDSHPPPPPSGEARVPPSRVAGVREEVKKGGG